MRKLSEVASQNTLQQPVEFSGTSLMRGDSVHLTLLPAPPDYGIAFERTDLEGSPRLALRDAERLTDVPHCTSVGGNDIQIFGIEHLLSALAGCEIDNVVVKLDAPEPPSFDGSAKPLVNTIQEAGITAQEVERRELTLDAPVVLSEGNAQIIARPAERFGVSFLFDYPDGPTQYAEFEMGEGNFADEIAQARTFCFDHEVEGLRAMGLGRGATEGQNVLVINREGETDVELRYPDELARHKILDLIGDLYLLGVLPKAHITCIRSGHTLNRQLMDKLRTQHFFRMEPPVDVTEIYDLLEHRYPFCMVDRIVEVEEGKRAVGIKNVTFNEQFFQGHFPGRPVMPAVLQLEALAQTAGYLVKRIPANRYKLGYFAAMDKVRFRRPVVPGDQLRLEVEVLRLRSKFVQIRGVATVEGQVATEAEFSVFLGEDRTEAQQKS